MKELFKVHRSLHDSMLVCFLVWFLLTELITMFCMVNLRGEAYLDFLL